MKPELYSNEIFRALVKARHWLKFARSNGGLAHAGGDIYIDESEIDKNICRGLGLNYDEISLTEFEAAVKKFLNSLSENDSN